MPKATRRRIDLVDAWPMADALDANDAPAPSRAPSRASANAKTFWRLMAEWEVSDEQALVLIGFDGRIGKSGKRPRFRLSTSQVRILEWLLEVSRVVGTMHGDAGTWLHRRNRSSPMNGRTPIDAMIEDGETAIATILRQLNREAMRRGLSAPRDRASEGRKR